MPKEQPLSEVSATRLLDLLCCDDEFRDEFAKDPCEALVRHGLQPLAVAGTCVIETSLATKQEFQKSRALLASVLTRKAVFHPPHFFQAGDVEAMVLHADQGKVA